MAQVWSSCTQLIVNKVVKHWHVDLPKSFWPLSFPSTYESPVFSTLPALPGSAGQDGVTQVREAHLCRWLGRRIGKILVNLVIFTVRGWGIHVKGDSFAQKMCEKNTSVTVHTKMMMYPCSYIDPCRVMSCLRICSCLLSLFHWSKHSDLHAALLLYPIFRIRGAGMVEPAFCVATVLVNHMMNHIFAVLWLCFRKYMTQEWKQNTYPRTNTCTLTTDSDKINHFTSCTGHRSTCFEF